MTVDKGTYLGLIQDLTVEIQEKEEERTEIVQAVRLYGNATWAEIGEALGRDRQAAWRKYHKMGETG